jgi:hypothetical protein
MVHLAILFAGRNLFSTSQDVKVCYGLGWQGCSLYQSDIHVLQDWDACNKETLSIG